MNCHEDLIFDAAWKTTEYNFRFQRDISMELKTSTYCSD